MDNNKDSMKNVVIVALSLCLVSAIIVSGSAVVLKPLRLANKALDRNKNILIAAGLFEQNVTAESKIDELFREFEVRLVDLEGNRFLTDDETTALGIDTNQYDQRRAAKDTSISIELSRDQDVASISRRARYSVAYLLKKQGSVETIVLPVHGYGLWSTLYGFIALESDLNTVSGITFYEHQETAGLGGEVDNPRWKDGWVGKQIYYADGRVALRVIKGSVDPASRDSEHQIDGLSGASLTSRGVQNLIAFWLGTDGFGPVLESLRGQG
ncbi:MAG: Na(+)-translocating NADH-quinone reductase subunit C [bacterium]